MWDRKIMLEKRKINLLTVVFYTPEGRILKND